MNEEIDRMIENLRIAHIDTTAAQFAALVEAVVFILNQLTSSPPLKDGDFRSRRRTFSPDT